MNYDDLDPQQQQAVELIRSAPVGVITGGPGTGKTTCLKVALDMLGGGAEWDEGFDDFLDNDLRYRSPLPAIVLCAPTGKAARRMTEATGRDACTVHRLLGYTGDGFRHNAANPLIGIELIIVDEASMMSTKLTASLFAALPPRTRVVFVGDVDQLPSVTPGAVLRDLIDSDTVDVVRLLTLHRAAQKSWICRNARSLITAGELELDGDFDDFFYNPVPDPEYLLQSIVENAKANWAEDMQILTPQRRGHVGLHSLNHALQQALCPHLGGAALQIHKDSKEHPGGVRVHVGDRVMNTRNNYEHFVMNGEIGVVTAVKPGKGRSATIRFEGHDELITFKGEELFALELAYAITIHKSQGSEWPLVFVVAHSEHSFMLTRRLLYTAMTRAKEHVWIFGDDKGVHKAMRDTKEATRETRLQQKIHTVLEAIQ